MIKKNRIEKYKIILLKETLLLMQTIGIDTVKRKNWSALDPVVLISKNEKMKYILFDILFFDFKLDKKNKK
jgi:hypothetical protein